MVGMKISTTLENSVTLVSKIEVTYILGHGNFLADKYFGETGMPGNVYKNVHSSLVHK